jgi:xanthine/uracil/vitamin C permease (AzgA family)
MIPVRLLLLHSSWWFVYDYVGSKYQFCDFSESIPAFLTIVMMPFAFSIAQGIVFGMLSFVLLKFLSGKFQQISVTMWIIFACL